MTMGLASPLMIAPGPTYDDSAEAQLVHLVYENTHVELPAVYLQRVRAHALFGVFAVDLLEL